MKLDDPMVGDGCRAERLVEAHRDLLRAACAEDPDIWEIYYSATRPSISTRASTLCSNDHGCRSRCTTATGSSA